MVHIRNLRKKLEKRSENPKYIVNVGKGVPDRVMKKLRSRLWIKLILSAVFAAACAALCLCVGAGLSYRLLDQIYINPAVILKQEEQYIKGFSKLCDRTEAFHE